MKYKTCNWYDYPQYYDLAFKEQTNKEASFINNVIQKYSPLQASKVFEPACGSGRLTIAVARHGYYCQGFDLNKTSLNYLDKKISQSKVDAQATYGRMECFALRLPYGAKFDAGFCTLSTFRHLHKTKDAITHLHHVAKHLKKGGVYLLGIHLITDKYDDCHESWDTTHGENGIIVQSSLRSTQYDLKNRLESIEAKILVTTPTEKIKLISTYQLKTYTLKQLHAILKQAPQLRHIATYDSLDTTCPVTLDTEHDDVVLVFKKE